MDLKLNSTMDYINKSLNYYHLEGMDLMDVPLMWMQALTWYFDNYQPCFSTVIEESWFLYLLLLQVKGLIVSHGIMKVLPVWVSLTCFPTLFAYYYYFAISVDRAACVFTHWDFAFLWTLLWQCRLNVTGEYLKDMVGITLGIIIFKLPSGILLNYMVCIIAALTLAQLFPATYLAYMGGMVLLEFFCDGFQFAVDALIVLIAVWYMIRSLLSNRFHIILIILVCCIYCISLDGSVFIAKCIYTYIFVIYLALYAVLVSEYGNDEEMCFLLSGISGILIVLSYCLSWYDAIEPKNTEVGEKAVDADYNFMFFTIRKSRNVSRVSLSNV